MSITRRQSGFTLLELLVTASLFVVVAGLTTSIFAGVSKMQLTRRGNQALAAQLRQIEQQITTDTQGSQVNNPPISTDPTIKILNSSGSRSDMVAIRRTVVTNSGANQSEWRIYCQSETTGRFLRYRIPYTILNGGEPPHLTGTTLACDSVGSSQVQNLFTTTGSTLSIASIVIDELIDSESQIASLRFTEQKPEVASVDSSFSGQLNSFRMEFTALNSVSDPSGLPIVFRTTINRLP